jgi:ATP-binding cassette subfamily C protein
MVAMAWLRGTTRRSAAKRVGKFVFQTDHYFRACEVVADACGIALKPVPRELMRDPSVDPISVISEANGVRYRYVGLAKQWQKDDIGPLLGFRLNGEAIALLFVEGKGYHSYDLLTEQLEPLGAKGVSSIQRRACVLYRSFAKKRLSLLDVIRFGLNGTKRHLRTILWLGIAETILGLVGPMSIGLILNEIVPGAERTELLQLSVILLTVTLGQTAMTAIRAQATLSLETQMGASIQSAVWNRMLSLPVSFFRRYGAGELAQRSLGISRIQEIVASTVVSSLISSLMSLFSVVLLFYYSWQLTIESLLIIMVANCFMIPYALSIQRPRRLQLALQVGVATKVLQFLNGIAKLRVVAAEGRAFALWANDFAGYRRFSVLARGKENVLNMMFSVLPPFCEMAVCATFGVAYLRKTPMSISPGEFIAFLWTLQILLHGLGNLQRGVLTVLSAVPLYEAARPIFHELPEATENKINPGKISGSIVLRNVTFRYLPERPPVLRDINMQIQPGQFVAIVGATGSGKSTLIRLLLGFEEPEYGTILYDHYDTAKINMQALRRQLGVVLQGGRLQNQTILRCIIGSAPLTASDAWEAAALAGMEEDIRKMPMGMSTRVGEGGINLSGGQRQRLMIARALVGKPKVLFLDEATSALDNYTQRIVTDNLELMKTTRVAIAHRLSTIRRADCLYVLENSALVESGTYHELIRRGGALTRLLARQL